MRSTLGIAVTFALAVLAQSELLGQCQRAGGGRGSQQASGPFQTVRFAQGGANPIDAMQQVAMRHMLMQQRIAAQPIQMQQIALREQAQRTQLARRRSTAQQRRAAELARREEIRAANFAKLKAAGSQKTLVAVGSE